MADYTITTTDLSGSIDGTATGVVITVVTGVATGGGGGGAVDSVNGHTGTVVLAASDVGAVPTSRTVNGKALSANITLSASDVSADASGAASTAQTAAQTYADTNKLAKSANLSDVASAATSRTNLGLGTAATKNIPASGNAATTEVVYGTDTRLSDARTPTSHTHAESDVTGLVTDLAGKVPTTRTVNGHALSADVTVTAADAGALATSSNLSDLGNAGTARTNLGLGTAATKDVAASGNASTSQVVKGDDTRLTDTRTPSAHASTHAAAGSDPVTISESQVTNLTTDLAAKAPLASPTFTGTPAAPTQTAGDNSTKLATTAYVDAAVAAGGGGGGGGKKTAVFKLAGTLSVGTGATRLYNDTGATWTLSSVRATVETSPSGGAVTIDFNKNGTTVFTTQANRPSIASGGTTNKATTLDVTSVADGDYLTVDVDVATAPAANLTVEVVYS